VKNVLKSSKPKNIFQFFTKPKSYGFMYDSVDFRHGILIILSSILVTPFEISQPLNDANAANAKLAINAIKNSIVLSL
jgi:hypothetical protein